MHKYILSYFCFCDGINPSTTTYQKKKKPRPQRFVIEKFRAYDFQIRQRMTVNKLTNCMIYSSKKEKQTKAYTDSLLRRRKGRRRGRRRTIRMSNRHVKELIVDNCPTSKYSFFFDEFI